MIHPPCFATLPHARRPRPQKTHDGVYAPTAETPRCHAKDPTHTTHDSQNAYAQPPPFCFCLRERVPCDAYVHTTPFSSDRASDNARAGVSDKVIALVLRQEETKARTWRRGMRQRARPKTRSQTGSDSTQTTTTTTTTTGYR
ncbi:unnamed protein product [Ectocarpus fasciculatus]